MLDDLDQLLVGALHVAPAASWDDLSSVLGVNSSTVSRRYARLVERNILKVVGQVDWALYSTTLPLHLRISTSGVDPEEVADQLAGIPEIQYLALTYGTYPIFATVFTADENRVPELLRRLYSMPGIASIVTMPVMFQASKGSQWDPGFLSPEQLEQCLKLAAPELPPMGLQTRGREVVPDLTEKIALALLQQDGRLASSRLAGPLGVATSTALRMVKKFEREGWFRARVEIAGEHIGFEVPFLLRIKAVPGRVEELCAALARHPYTRFVTAVAADCDIISTGIVRDREHLADVVHREISLFPGIRDIEVELVRFELKRYWVSRDAERKLGTFSPPPLL